MIPDEPLAIGRRFAALRLVREEWRDLTIAVSAVRDSAGSNHGVRYTVRKADPDAGQPMSVQSIDRAGQRERNIARAKRLHEDGLSVRHIAAELGIPRGTVHGYVTGRRAKPVAVVESLRPEPVAGALPDRETPCSTHPTPDLWFTEESHRTNVEAKAICRGCPVVDACLQYALDAAMPYGIWGALTTAERRALVRKLRRT